MEPDRLVLRRSHCLGQHLGQRIRSLPVDCPESLKIIILVVVGSHELAYVVLTNGNQMFLFYIMSFGKPTVTRYDFLCIIFFALIVGELFICIYLKSELSSLTLRIYRIMGALYILLYSFAHLRASITL